MHSPRFRVVGMEDIDDAAVAPETEQSSQSMNDTKIMSPEDLLENPNPLARAHMFDALHTRIDETLTDIDERDEAHNAIDGLDDERMRRMYALLTGNDTPDCDFFVRTSELNRSDIHTAGIHSKVRWKTPRQ